MKNFLLCIVLSFLVISCSTESDFNHSVTPHSIAVALQSKSQIPLNNANPFDTAGKKYFDLLNIYLKNNKVPNSIKGVTEQIQFLSKNYGSASFTSRSTVAFTPEQVTLIMGDPINQLRIILESYSLSTEVKHYLVNFLQALVEQQGLEYPELYHFIISYETGIIESTLLNEDEKETILTVSSISRYALYVDSKHKDRDWETSVGNKTVQPIFDSYHGTIITVIASLRKLL
jgi:hypothetical protein